MNLPALQWLALGGPAMWLLALLSVATLALVIVKAWEFTEAQLTRRAFVEPALNAWAQGRGDQALAVVAGERSPLAQVMTATLQSLRSGMPEARVREEVQALALHKLDEARGLFRALDTIGTLAPLLGLLGTVLGLIQAFQKLETGGDAVNPAMLSGGIWQALLTTAGGLIVAIPAIAALNLFDRLVERLQRDMESALSRIFAHSSRAP